MTDPRLTPERLAFLEAVERQRLALIKELRRTTGTEPIQQGGWIGGKPKDAFPVLWTPPAGTR